MTAKRILTATIAGVTFTRKTDKGYTHAYGVVNAAGKLTHVRGFASSADKARKAGSGYERYDGFKGSSVVVVPVTVAE